MTSIKALLASTVLLCLSCKVLAFEQYSSFANGHGEETILIESNPDTEFSYSKTIKSLSKQALRFYIGSLLSGGKNCTESFIRNFNDLADRTKYTLNLKQEQIELELTLNF